MRFLLLIFIFAWPENGAWAAKARLDCERRVFQQGIPAHVETFLASLSEDPFEQWLRWENEACYPSWRNPHPEVSVNFVEVQRHEFDVETLAQEASSELDFFHIRNEWYRWFFHPYHRFDQSPIELPFQGRAKVATTTGTLVSGRGIVFRAGPDAISVKLPTTHPQGTRTPRQHGKENLASSLAVAVPTSRYLERVRSFVPARFHENLNYSYLLDRLSVTAKSHPNGFIVRDLTPLLDGNYYLPAFSIPYVGRYISDLNEAPFEVFWGKAFAELQGYLWAAAYILEGEIFLNPHPQNLLIQLDPLLQPTGRFFIRDVPDVVLAGPAYERLGKFFPAEAKRLRGKGLMTRSQKLQRLTEGFHYLTHNFELAPEQWRIAPSVLRDWQRQARMGARRAIFEILGVKLTHGNPLKYLVTDEGDKLIRKFLRTW